ncbi:hypothetical protein NP493_564g01023 [Ridgeia piscesae]|uniref:RAB6A-GEF complex partner protein 2 n=1 Tax=Ridgeia piscesae TaxID=27915 RepID=A0AAD9KWH8_RIDPI|nr:hypothetical protein NP493_564g01023 [Ridgeia piscesae]
MIEVTASLLGRSVFLAGETVKCQITFTNVCRTNRQSSPTKARPATLAWASAQIHCQCNVTEGRVAIHPPTQLTTAQVTTSGNDTAFVPFRGERGSTVLSTRPSILFCDLTLAPGESHTCVYQESLPLDAPPSFRGSAVKYSYKLTIGTQRFSCATKLLRVPFRVFVLPGLNDLTVYSEPEELKPNNPFQTNPQTENSLLDIALEVLQTMTCRKGPSFYNITNSHGRVARFCLFKQAYRIGDDIVGTCDFTEATVPCVQFSVTLQSEEQVAEDCQCKPGQSSTVTSYSKTQELCIHTSKTHINIAIPLTATPAFITDIVCLRWHLHFEFVTCKTPLPQMTIPDNPSKAASLQGPAQLDVDTMVWDLPIRVFATNPVYASSVSLLRTDTSCCV